MTLLSLWQRFLIRLGRPVYVGDRRRPGWSGTLPFYAFRCPRHGVVESYKHGFYGRLDCPRCGFSVEMEPRLEALP